MLLCTCGVVKMFMEWILPRCQGRSGPSRVRVEVEISVDALTEFETISDQDLKHHIIRLSQVISSKLW